MRIFMILCLFAPLGVSQSNPPKPLGPIQTVPFDSHWRAEVLVTCPTKLSGCAIGDVDPETPGAEVVAVGGNGTVIVVGRAEVGWAQKAVFQAKGELIQVAIADLNSGTPGQEILAVGKLEGAERAAGPGAVYLLSRTSSGFEGKVLFQSDALVHGVCARPGEAIVTGYDKKVHRFQWLGTEVTHTILAELPGPGKNCLWRGAEIVVACSDGSLITISEGGEGATRLRLIDRREKGRGRLGTDGERLVVSDDDGTLSMYEGDSKSILLSGSGLRQRGAVIADLDLSRAGHEVATAGYDRCIRVFFVSEKGYGTIVPYVDPERFHHLAVGQLDDDDAMEIVGASFSGNLVLVEAIPRER